MAQRAKNGETDRTHDTPWVIAAIGLSVVCTLLAGVTIRDVLSEPNPSSQDASEVQSSEAAAASLVMAVDDYAFSIKGVVGDEQTLLELQEATNLAYGDRSSFDVTVDSSGEGVTNVEGVGQLPQNLSRLIEGAFEISGNRITIRGMSPDLTTEFNLVRLATTLGFVDVDDQLEVAELSPSTVEFKLTGAAISAKGRVADQQVVSLINQELVGQFGDANVDTSGLVPTEDVFSQFEIITTAANLGVYAGFGDFQLTIQNNDTDGAWDQGLGFSSGDSTLTSEQEQKLAGFPPLLRNRPDLQILITGHTDDEGTPEKNQTLSQARAQAIVDYFVANGVDVSRVIGIGRGANEPVASNDTVEGRAQNRRVTFALR